MPSEPLSQQPTIHVVALACWKNGELLVVQKRNRPVWFQPGGKPEPGESLEAALRREIDEELGCELANVQFLGQFITMAANEAGHVLIADMFSAELVGEPLPRAEIVAVRWMSIDEVFSLETAPLIREHVVPIWRK